MQKIKKFVFAAALTLGVMTTAGLSLVQAQWPWQNRDSRWEQQQRQRERERQRQWEWEQRQRQRNGGSYGNGGYYGNNGGYNGNNGGYYGNSGRNNAEYEKGFRDGLRRGQEDLNDRRRADPNNSSHYRKGNSVYRDGFRQGYREGYQSYGYNRGW